MYNKAFFFNISICVFTEVLNHFFDWLSNFFSNILRFFGCISHPILPISYASTFNLIAVNRLLLLCRKLFFFFIVHYNFQDKSLNKMYADKTHFNNNLHFNDYISMQISGSNIRKVIAFINLI